jgi:hypothetical protein
LRDHDRGVLGLYDFALTAVGRAAGSIVHLAPAAALKEMLMPGAVAIVVPVAIGVLLGAQVLAGALAGADTLMDEEGRCGTDSRNRQVGHDSRFGFLSLGFSH